VVPEYYAELKMVEATAEAELVRAFTEASYQVVDEAEYAAARYAAEMDEILADPTGAAAQSLANEHGAHILIVGKATSERYLPTATAAVVCNARIEARAVAIEEEAQVIGSASTTGRGTQATESAAAKEALRDAAEAVAPALLALVNKFLSPSTQEPAAEEGQPAPAPARAATPRVAVLPFDDLSQCSQADWDPAAQIPDMIADELAKTGRLELVDRAAIAQFVKQEGPEQTGLFDEEGKAQEVGASVQADYVVTGRIEEFTVRERGSAPFVPEAGGVVAFEAVRATILIKVIDVHSGAVLSTTEAKGEATKAVVRDGYVGITFDAAQFDRTAVGDATRRAVAQAASAILSALPITCPGCGAAITIGDKFCPQCGYDLSAKPLVCPKCGAAAQPEDTFCRKCGARL
jgi:TolB-like protein